MTDWNP
ncbi:beta-lactamase family protein, partial [Vibrio parahaemolyticus V-223/04]